MWAAARACRAPPLRAAAGVVLRRHARVRLLSAPAAPPTAPAAPTAVAEGATAAPEAAPRVPWWKDPDNRSEMYYAFLGIALLVGIAAPVVTLGMLQEDVDFRDSVRTRFPTLLSLISRVVEIPDDIHPAARGVVRPGGGAASAGAGGVIQLLAEDGVTWQPVAGDVKVPLEDVAALPPTFIRCEPVAVAATTAGSGGGNSAAAASAAAASLSPLATIADLLAHPARYHVGQWSVGLHDGETITRRAAQLAEAEAHAPPTSSSSSFSSAGGAQPSTTLASYIAGAVAREKWAVVHDRAALWETRAAATTTGTGNAAPQFALVPPLPVGGLATAGGHRDADGYDWLTGDVSAAHARRTWGQWLASWTGRGGSASGGSSSSRGSSRAAEGPNDPYADADVLAAATVDGGAGGGGLFDATAVAAPDEEETAALARREERLKRLVDPEGACTGVLVVPGGGGDASGSIVQAPPATSAATAAAGAGTAAATATATVMASNEWYAPGQLAELQEKRLLALARATGASDAVVAAPAGASAAAASAAAAAAARPPHGSRPLQLQRVFAQPPYEYTVADHIERLHALRIGREKARAAASAAKTPAALARPPMPPGAQASGGLLGWMAGGSGGAAPPPPPKQEEVK